MGAPDGVDVGAWAIGMELIMLLFWAVMVVGVVLGIRG